jgi:hypothetical protein
MCGFAARVFAESMGRCVSARPDPSGALAAHATVTADRGSHEAFRGQRQTRNCSGPSDHAPVMVDLDDAADCDIGLDVPPPSGGRL